MNLLQVSMALALGASLFAVRQTEKATETVSLPTGEFLTNESFLSLGRDSVRHNKLFFQQSASSPRELLGEIIGEHARPISLQNPAPQLQRSGDRTAVIIGGSHVFQRSHLKKGPYWLRKDTKPDSPASFFLRTFIHPESFRPAPGKTLVGSDAHNRQIARSISIPPPDRIRRWLDIPRPEAAYVFDRLDLDQNVLVTRRISLDATFPEFLVYSQHRYGWSWQFDIERTRLANDLKPPSDSGFLIDFSVITYPGELTHSNKRDDFLAVPSAKEVHTQTLPLSSSNWTPSECTILIPTGKPVNRRYEALLGFCDPWPDFVSVLWREHPAQGTSWRCVKVGDWEWAVGGQYEGGLSYGVFFRVRRSQPR